MERFLTIRETASTLGLSVDAVRKRIERGQLPYRKYGKRVLIPADERHDLMKRLPGVRGEDIAAIQQEGSKCKKSIAHPTSRN